MPERRARRAGRTASPSRCGRGRPGSRTRAGCRGSARRRSSSLGELLVGRVPLAPRARVQPLRERLGEPVGERLDHDRAVVVVLAPRSAAASSSAPWIATANAPTWSPAGRDVVGEAAVRPAVVVVACWRRKQKRVPSSDDVVALGVRGPEAVHAARVQRAVAHELVEHAPARRRRARARPGCSRIAGNLPFRSQAWKKNCQSMYAARARRASGSTRARAGERRHGQVVERDPRRGSRAPPRAGAAAALLLGVLLAQALLQLAVLGVERAAAAPGRAAPETTSTTRLASSTCTVSCEYAGAIRTAVCCRDVVAPPISSGRSSPRRSISSATSTIWSSDGVIRPERPTTSAPSATAVSRIRSAGTITPRSITS